MFFGEPGVRFKYEIDEIKKRALREAFSLNSRYEKQLNKNGSFDSKEFYNATSDQVIADARKIEAYLKGI